MRPRHDRRLLLVLVVLVTALCLWVSAAAAAAVGGAADEAPAAADPTAPRGIERPADPVPSRYIVTLKESTGEVEAAADALAADVHGEVVDVYTHALSGFSVRMSEADARAQPGPIGRLGRAGRIRPRRRGPARRAMGSRPDRRP